MVQLARKVRKVILAQQVQMVRTAEADVKDNGDGNSQ